MKMKNAYQTLAILMISLLIGGCAGQFSLPDEIPGMSAKRLTDTEIRNGLVQALEQGVKNAVSQAGRENGFYSNNTLYIPFPPEAHKVRQAAVNYGLKNQVEDFEKQLNRAAEKAAANAGDIFLSAVNEMTISDARRILKGDDHAATDYFKTHTTQKLYTQSYPVIKNATDQVALTKHWTPIIGTYNKARILTGDPEIDTDLNAYVTHRMIDGLFVLIAKEEQQIRNNPEKRITELLRKVFGSR